MPAAQKAKIKAEPGIKPEPSPSKPIGINETLQNTEEFLPRRETRSIGIKRLKEEDGGPQTPPIKRELRADDIQQPKKRRQVKAEAKVQVAGLTLTSEAPTVASGPFPHLLRPTPAECRVSKSFLII